MDDLRHLLTQEPFHPFQGRLTGGDNYDIRDPVSAAMIKSRLFVADSRSDRSVYVHCLHIAALETPANGRQKRPGRRRK